MAIKEVRLSFRDVGSLLTMLVTPLLLTLVIAAAFGGGDSTALDHIPVAVADLDGGTMATALVAVLTSADLDTLLDVVPVDTPLDGDAARRMVDEGQAAVAVIIPAGFSEAIVPGDWRGVVASSGQAVAVEVYGRSDARYSTLVVQNVVSRVLVRMSTITRGITAAATWLLCGRDPPPRYSRRRWPRTWAYSAKPWGRIWPTANRSCSFGWARRADGPLAGWTTWPAPWRCSF
jgi:ABC-2 type transport system permease protein